MAKLARAVRLAYAGPLALWALLPASAAYAVDLDSIQSTVNSLDVVKPNANSWRIVPMLDLRQIFTDNVNSQGPGRARSQFITDIAPGVMVSHRGPRVIVDGKFQFHYYANAHKDTGARRSSNRLNGNAKAELVDDMVFVDASAGSFQQGISPFGALVSDNDYASANRANVTTWQISPYVMNRYGRVARSELRYTHDQVKTSSGGLRNSSGDALVFRLNSGAAFRDFGWGLNLSKQRIDYAARNDSTFQNASLNLSYQLLPTFGLTAAALYDDYDYEAIGGANGGDGWTAGFRWTPSRRTLLQASAGQRYYGPSRSLKAQHRSRNTVWNLSYDDSVATTRGNFLMPVTLTPDPATGLPVIIGPADLGGDLLRPDLPRPAPVPNDPVTGLPPSLTENLNFFSNRFSLQKQLRASVVLRAARSSATVSLFKVRREALSLREDDSEILGSPIDRVNDNIEQLGMNVSLIYRLSPRSSMSLSGDVIDSESLTTGFRARSNATRLTLRHQLGRNIAGSVELRRLKGLTGLTSGVRYTENALSASLNMQL